MTILYNPSDAVFSVLFRFRGTIIPLVCRKPTFWVVMTIQIVLLVAPLLVFSWMALGQPLDLCFSMFEVVAIVLTIFLTREIIADGRTTWIEGVLLLATYAILVIGFYHLPDAALVDGQAVLPAHVR